jgi:hypothetical protein
MNDHELAVARYIAIRAYMDEYGIDERTDDFRSIAKRAGKTAAAIGGTVAVSAGAVSPSSGYKAVGDIARTGSTAIQQRNKIKKNTQFKPSTKVMGSHAVSSHRNPVPSGSSQRPISSLFHNLGESNQRLR